MDYVSSSIRSPLLLLPAVVIAIALYLSFDGPYIYSQWSGFFRTVVLSRDIERMRARGDLDEETEQLFLRAEEMRAFAQNELGLAPSRNFTRYSNIEQSFLVSVVSAVSADGFARVTWNYPILGRLFYRGFYDPSRAEAEAERLRGRGYDVLVRRVNAFSTLGYFVDPLYSFMADYSEYRLANLLIHEEMHATVWIDRQNIYNEEIATLFIREKYGLDSPEYRAIYDERQDRETFREWIRSVYRELAVAYESLDTREERIAAKESIFDLARADFAQRYDKLFVTDRYRSISARSLDNAYIDAHYKYSGDLSLYYRLYEHFDYDLSAVIDSIKASADYPANPREFLELLMEFDRFAYAGDPVQEE